MVVRCTWGGRRESNDVDPIRIWVFSLNGMESHDSIASKECHDLSHLLIKDAVLRTDGRQHREKQGGQSGSFCTDPCSPGGTAGGSGALGPVPAHTGAQILT